MRHLTSLLSFGRAGRLLAAALATLALISAGCGGGGSAPDVRKVVDDSARAAAVATRLSDELARQWCPHAVRHHGRALTPRRARACLARAHRAWLRELRREGYDPYRVGRP